ncbi:hypothetical protein ACT3R5_04960 [Glutamicibacter sp. AOP5-A2-7]
MAKKIKVKLKSAGARALLNDPAVASLLMSEGQKIANRAGPGYEAVAGTRGQTRARVFIGTETTEAAIDNARNATLLRALGGG